MEENVIRLTLVVKDHEEEKQNIRKENEQLSKDITAVKNDLSQLQASLESTAITKSTVEELTSSNNETDLITMMELEELRLERTKLQQELTTLKHQVLESEKLKSERDKLEAALAESKAKAADLEAMLIDMEREKNIAMKNSEQGCVKIKECERAMEIIEGDCAVVKRDLVTAERRISELEAILEISENRGNELERDFISTKERNLTLETGYNRIQEIESGLRQEIVSLHKRATLSEKDAVEKRNQIEVLERRREEDDGKFEKLRKEYEEVSRELAELKSVKNLDSNEVSKNLYNPTKKRAKTKKLEN